MHLEKRAGGDILAAAGTAGDSGGASVWTGREGAHQAARTCLWIRRWPARNASGVGRYLCGARHRCADEVEHRLASIVPPQQLGGIAAV